MKQGKEPGVERAAGEDDDRARALESGPDADLHVDPGMAVEELVTMIEEAVRPWRAAKCLKKLKAQVNAAYPGRSIASDGMIGDPAHQSRASDHNAWITDGAEGVVSAFDITHDPRNGCDAGKIAEALRASRDRRIKYIIWNRRIANASPIDGAAAWAWRPYTGRNPHDHHCHVSVQPDKTRYDDEAPWTLPG